MSLLARPSTLAFLSMLVCTILPNFQGVDAGERCLQCPSQDPSDPCLLPVQIPCKKDCTTNHNSAEGTCDSEYNCECSGIGTPPGNCSYPNGDSYFPGVCQCKENDTKTKREEYAKICRIDCQCNHGALNGTCLYDIQQCQCIYPDGYTWQTSDCPVQGAYNAGTLLQELIGKLVSVVLELAHLGK